MGTPTRFSVPQRPAQPAAMLYTLIISTPRSFRVSFPQRRLPGSSTTQWFDEDGKIVIESNVFIAIQVVLCAVTAV